MSEVSSLQRDLIRIEDGGQSSWERELRIEVLQEIGMGVWLSRKCV
jgi:hypothetical protein